MQAPRKVPRAPASRPAREPLCDTTRPAPATGDSDCGDSALGSPGTEGSAHAPLDPAEVRAALAAVGLLVPLPEFDDLPTDPAEREALERDDEAWLLATFTKPLGLSEAVIEDRGW
jgi:hypothetical protein